MSQRIVICPLYDTLGPNATSYIIDHAELSCVICERSKLENLLKGKGKKGYLKNLVVFEDVTPQERQMAAQSGVYVRVCVSYFFVASAVVPVLALMYLCDLNKREKFASRSPRHESNKELCRFLCDCARVSVFVCICIYI